MVSNEKIQSSLSVVESLLQNHAPKFPLGEASCLDGAYELALLTSAYASVVHVQNAQSNLAVSNYHALENLSKQLLKVFSGENDFSKVDFKSPVICGSTRVANGKP